MEGRKNLEAIAAAATPVKADANLGQALQHFVTRSPWDAEALFARYRALLPRCFRVTPGTWVLHDGVLLKKGRNSVGTQRQFARPLGKKVNCQIAVVVSWQCAAGLVPLAIRLYLPGYWLRENPVLVERTVPADHRTPTSKAEIAAALLAGLQAESWNAKRAVLDEGYASTEGFAESLVEREIEVVNDESQLLNAAEQFEWLKTRLGLDHFEGRTWIGWHHHVAMVLAAAGFLIAEQSR